MVMCRIIVINKGEKEIGTPRDFINHFGLNPDIDFKADNDNLDECLCHCDIEEVLNLKGIFFEAEDEDVFIN